MANGEKVNIFQAGLPWPVVTFLLSLLLLFAGFDRANIVDRLAGVEAELVLMRAAKQAHGERLSAVEQQVRSCLPRATP